MVPTTDELNIERTIRERLRGVELVCEAEPTEAELTAAEATCRLAFARRAVDDLRIRLPATFVSYVVMRGSERYCGNVLWPHLGVHAESNRVGRAFLAALHRLGLPDFQRMAEREGARRYVTPVLIHGAIPAGSARPLVERIERELRLGLVDGNEAVQRLANDPSLVAEIGRPATLLIQHVPAFAADLIDLLVDRITGTPRGPGHHDLPRHIQEALERGDAPGRRGLRRIRPPYVEIDPWSGLGPELVAPDCNRQVVWHFDGGSGPKPVQPGQRTLLSPVDRLSITGNGPPRTLWQHPVLWFDVTSGRLLTGSTTIPSHALVLLPPGWDIAPTAGGTVVIEAEGLALSGPWSRHRLRYVKAPSDTVIRLEGPGGRGATVRAMTTTRQPTLQGVPVLGLRSRDDRQVFGGAPAIQAGRTETTTSVWWTIDGEPTQLAELAPDPGTGTVDLAPLLPGDRAYGLTVQVRGTDDRRTALTCVVAPSTTIELPTDPLGPEDECQFTVIGPGGNVARVHAAALAEAVPLDAPWAPTGLLEVVVPRIRWALRSRRPARLDLASGTIEAKVEDLVDETPFLVVRGPGGSVIRLLLLVDGAPTQVASPQLARGLSPDRAQVVFPLVPMADSIRSHRTHDLRLVLEMEGRRIEAICSGTGRTENPRRSWGRMAEPANRTGPAVGALVSTCSHGQDVIGGAAAELVANLAGLDPGDRLVQFIRKLGSATGNWAASETKPELATGKGPGGVEWSEYEAAADVLWHVRGVRYREVAGSRLEEACRRWAHRRFEALRNASLSRRAAADLWSRGKVPTEEQLRDWSLGQIVRATRVRSRGVETATDQFPRALIFQVLLVAADDPSASGAVAAVEEIDSEGLVGALALLLELARSGYRLDLGPPPLAGETPGPGSLPTAEPTPASITIPLQSLERCAVNVEDSTLNIAAPLSERFAAPVIRLVAADSAKPLAVLSTLYRDGLFTANLPPDLHGRVRLAVVDRTNVPTRPDVVERSVVDLGPLQPLATSPKRCFGLGELKQGVVDHIVDDLVLTACTGRLEVGLVERLFDDEHAAGAALVGVADRYHSGALDRVGIVVLPAATLFSRIVSDVTSLRAICRNAPILGAALLPAEPAAWRALGWSNPNRFNAGGGYYEDIVKLAQRLTAEVGCCRFATYRYQLSNRLDSERARRTIRQLEAIDVPRAVVDLAIVTRRALAIDALSGEATRALLASHAEDPAATTAGVLVGTALTYAENAVPGAR